MLNRKPFRPFQIIGTLIFIILMVACNPSAEPDPTISVPESDPTQIPQEVVPTETPVPEVTEPAPADPTMTPEPAPPDAGGGEDVVVAFDAGATSTTIDGSVAPNVPDTYRVTAQDGQLMTVNVTSSDPDNTGLSLFGPNSDIPFVMADAGFVPTGWKGILFGSGEFKIDVYTFNQESRYQLEIEILPNTATDPAIRADYVVQFPAGSTGTTIEATLNPDQIDIFRLSAGAGQQLNLRLIGEIDGNGAIGVYGPDNTPIVGGVAETYPAEWTAVLPTDGEYRVEVDTLTEGMAYLIEFEIVTASNDGSSGPEGYTLAESRDIGSYRFEIWIPEEVPFDGIGRLMQGETIIAETQFARSIRPESGSDINGNGTPDLIVDGYSGGAHCCSSTHIFDLGDTATEILNLQSDNCGSSLVDLNGDGIFEVSTCDDSFAYRYCAYAASPAVSVYYTYDGTQYVPSAPNDVALYTDEIENATNRASQGNTEGWDGSNKCDVLGLALINLYTGDPTAAYQALEQYYLGGDLAYLWADILNVVNRSEMYVPTGAPPAVSIPDYYDIHPATACDEFGFSYLLSSVGGDPCQERIGDGLIFVDVPILEFGETARLPDSCGADCLIDIFYYDPDTQTEFEVGYLSFVREEGRPIGLARFAETGQYVSGPWYLRGDLQWELGQ